MISNFTVNMDEYLPLRDVVFKTLRQAILKGELKPGERLMEIALAEKLGVSRTPIREAIRKLELEGLVVMVPRKGAHVANITEKDLNDVLEVREALEELAVKNACDCATEEQLKALKQAANDFKRCAEGDDLLGCVGADMQFHEIIYSATNNKRLQQMLLNLREQMYRYRMEYMKDKRMYKLLIDEHDAIRKAVKKKDKEKAGQVMRTHIINQQEAIERNLAGPEK